LFECVGKFKSKRIIIHGQAIAVGKEVSETERHAEEMRYE